MPDDPLPPSPSDSSGHKTEFIIQSARSGNQGAWRELYERYERMLVVNLEYRMPGFLRRRFDAEDVLQEAFAKAYNSIQDFDYQGEGSFRKWLRKIVTHEFKNLIKAQNRERRNASTEESGSKWLTESASPGPGPSQLLRALEQKRELFAKLADLEEEEREIITMRIFEKKSWNNVAKVIGCGRDAAEARFGRAIKKLARGIQ